MDKRSDLDPVLGGKRAYNNPEWEETLPEIHLIRRAYSNHEGHPWVRESAKFFGDWGYLTPTLVARLQLLTGERI